MPTDKFLTMAANMLNKAFLESPRTQAKSAYKAMADGATVPITNVKMEDGSLVRFEMSLDHTEFQGTLNYGAFRASVMLLIGNLAQTLREDKEVTVFSAEHDPNVMIFGITAVTYEKDQPSVMVLGADAAQDRPSVVLRLMYLDYNQFAELAPENAAAAEAAPTQA